MTLATSILNLFHGREDYVAVPNGHGFQPHKLDQPMRPGWLEKEHLSGKRCLGFYVLTTQSRCFCSAVDFDNKPDMPDPEWQTKASHVYYELVGYGLTPLVEISQSGHAAHVWLFFEDGVDAWLVRKFWAAVSKTSGVPFVEVYPRQDELSGKQLGNLIRYPLWNKSKLVDIENDWTELDPAMTLGSAVKTDDVTLRTLLYQMTGETAAKPAKGVSVTGLPRRVDQIVSRQHTLVGRRWQGDMEGLNDKSRSALVQSIACELVRLYVPTPEVQQAIKVWCDQNDYKKGDRYDWVDATVAKAYEFVGGRDEERIGTSWTMQDATLEFIDGIGNELPVFESGVGAVDRSIDGVAIGEMAVIAARPSHGKTAFGLAWVDHVARLQTPCLIISEEMSRLQLAKRALLSISAMESEDWGGGQDQLREEVRQHYENRSPVYGVESCQSIDAVEQVVALHCEIKGVRLVAVDYLQLLNSASSNRYESVTEISRRLKQMATKYKCAMLVMCQLNRDIERRDKDTPRLSDLRESGQIEQDADLILFLQWPCRNNISENAARYLVWCAKRRNGPIRSPLVETVFDAERQRFGVVESNPLSNWTYEQVTGAKQ